MQMRRLFEIVYILLNKKIVTAKELAEHFEVSIRTIYRDITMLTIAGIPIYTNKGKGGGIRLLDNFILSKSFFSEKEQNEILTALQSLKIIHQGEVDDVLSKLSAIFNKDAITNWISVDFSDWSDAANDRFSMIKTAIINKKIIICDYYGRNGEKLKREIEPLQLYFKSKSWYVKGYCLHKKAYRLFKLNRMKNIELTNASFERDLPQEKPNIMNQETKIHEITLKINSQLSYRVYDEFDEGEITKDEDGNFIATIFWTFDEWTIGYILSFGPMAEVVAPDFVRECVANTLKKTLDQYESFTKPSIKYKLL